MLKAYRYQCPQQARHSSVKTLVKRKVQHTPTHRASRKRFPQLRQAVVSAQATANQPEADIETLSDIKKHQTNRTLAPKPSFHRSILRYCNPIYSWLFGNHGPHFGPRCFMPDMFERKDHIYFALEAKRLKWEDPPPPQYHHLLEAVAKVGLVEARFGYNFKDKMLCVAALKNTGDNWPLYCDGKVYEMGNNRGFAHVGDRALQLALDDIFFHVGNALKDYSRMTSTVESRVAFDRKGREIGLHESIITVDAVGTNPKHVAETFEAVFGAIYVDCDRDINTLLRIVKHIGLDQHELLTVPSEDEVQERTRRILRELREKEASERWSGVATARLKELRAADTHGHMASQSPIQASSPEDPLLGANETLDKLEENHRRSDKAHITISSVSKSNSTSDHPETSSTSTEKFNKSEKVSIKEMAESISKSRNQAQKPSNLLRMLQNLWRNSEASDLEPTSRTQMAFVEQSLIQIWPEWQEEGLKISRSAQVEARSRALKLAHTLPENHDIETVFLGLLFLEGKRVGNEHKRIRAQERRAARLGSLAREESVNIEPIKSDVERPDSRATLLELETKIQDSSLVKNSGESERTKNTSREAQPVLLPKKDLTISETQPPLFKNVKNVRSSIKRVKPDKKEELGLEQDLIASSNKAWGTPAPTKPFSAPRKATKIVLASIKATKSMADVRNKAKAAETKKQFREENLAAKKSKIQEAFEKGNGEKGSKIEVYESEVEGLLANMEKENDAEHKQVAKGKSKDHEAKVDAEKMSLLFSFEELNTGKTEKAKN